MIICKKTDEIDKRIDEIQNIEQLKAELKLM